MRKKDKIAIVVLIVFLIAVAYPIYKSKDGCEIAKDGYTCGSVKDTMIENCEQWGEFQCEHCEKNEWQTCIDASVPNIEWYIGELCVLENDEHGTGLDCSDLKSACDEISGKQVCP